ncbi:MAG: DNA-processing protein DprA [Clostridia bacterium]|nr:DNA-processing protein DprA [Clostridia bacterium]
MIYKIENTNNLFPEKLKNITPKIKEIYVEGNIKILNNFGIAVIGSRNSSKEGEKITNEIVEKLSKYNINIISGLALGIDTQAHNSCLYAKGKTIAVIGSGFNHIYPTENKDLFQRIIKSGGAIISEYPPETIVESKNFPKRNRIISALSDGILVIEGKYGSGTGITAKLGVMQNKPIFCIPHSIYNKYGKIPNDLIKKGANLVTSSKDILDYYKKQNINLDLEESKSTYNNEILEILKKEILNKEEISKKLNKSISQVNQELTLLELEGLITEEYGKGYRIIE